MTEANAAVEAVETETTETTTQDAGKAVETVATEKAADTTAKGADATGEAAGQEGADGKTEGDDKSKGEADDKAKTDDFSWPDDWRERLSGDDEDLAKILKRFTSPANFARKIAEQEKIIRSGKLQKPMPDGKDEKAMAEWRKEQGIPDDPSGYKLPDTVAKRLTDDDKPILATFTDFAHKNSMPPAFVEKASEWYVSQMEAVAEDRAARDASALEEAEDALRKDWSHGEFKANMTLAKRAIEGIPGVGAEWSEFRGPDGKRLGDNPAFISWAADLGREKFGDVTFATGDSERKHTARRAEIETIRNTDFDRYEAEGLDKEYRAIIEKDLARGKR